METITLDAHICDQRRSYTVRFDGPDAEAMAVEFIKARMSTHVVSELESTPIHFYDDAHDPNTWRNMTLYALLYPECEHGLSESNCYGPQHYYFDEEEQARGMRNGW